MEPITESKEGPVRSDLRDAKEKSDSNKVYKTRDIGERLESVLEYTGRIKAFLGLQEESDSAENSIEKIQENEVTTDAVVLSSIENVVDEENSQPKDSDPLNNELNYQNFQPLPDLIGIQPESSEDAEQYPDILEPRKNFNTEDPTDIFENSPDITGVPLTTSDNNINLKKARNGSRDPQTETVYGKVNLIDTESKNEVTNVNKAKNNDISNSEDKDEKGITVGNYISSSFLGVKSKEYQVPAFSQNYEQANQTEKSEEIPNKEDSDDENPYQITHIEEGLRQVEKSLKTTHPQKSNKQQKMPKDFAQEPEEQQTVSKDIPQEPDEPQKIFKDVLQEPEDQKAIVSPKKSNEQKTVFEDLDDSPDKTAPMSLKSRSKQSMEDIRRLSAEVVNFVLQTAGDEVKVILTNRNSVTEENKCLSTIEVESRNDPKIILPLKDSEVEYKGENLEEACLADIPEEESLRTFSSMSDVRSASVSTAIEIKTIPVGSKHSIDRIEVTDEIDFDTQCGFGLFKPQCIQRYATANVYVILYSIIGILHGSYYTYLVGVLTTLEKRFEFKSKTSGFIMMLDELTPLFLGVLMGHFGGRAHRPRLLSFGMFLSAFCCFASALPYFLYGTATHLSSIDSVHNKTSAEMCNGDVRIEHCDADDRPPTVTAILLLMLGSFLKGFGNLAYYAIGLAYLDDNAKKRNTPLYFAVAFALRLLGPMMGFLMSSAFLKYYENPFETPDFGPDDPRWIGGWWMGFVLQGILLLIFAGPMALFPRRLPDHRPLMHEIEPSSSMFDGLGDSLKRLARNPLYILIGLNTIFTVYGNFGYYIMMPKYMENQFRLSASSASLFAGPPGIAALMVSCIIGGYLIWKFKPTAKFLAGGLVTLELIATLGYLILMIPQCEKIDMTHFGLSDDGLILENECTMNCSCSTVSFTPVCGPDGKSSYFSPCYAGCSYQEGQAFYNCSCLRDSTEKVTKGICSSENCWSQALAYIVALPVLQFIVNILRVAYTMILLRSIKPEDKNIALGVFETVLSTIAFIPFPVLYGALVDSACLVWEKSCGETGNCWFYDIQKFNYLIHGGSAFFCGLSTLNLVAIFFLVDRIKDLYKEEDEDTEDTREKKINVKL